MNNVLIHHGIKGQRWGVIRNAKSIAESSSKIARDAKGINESTINMRRSAVKSKDLSNMSDQELRNKVNRMNLERQYSDLSSSKTARGQSYVSDVLEITGGALAITSSALAIALAVKQLKK